MAIVSLFMQRSLIKCRNQVT